MPPCVACPWSTPRLSLRHRERMKYWNRSSPCGDPDDARFKTMPEVECHVLRLQNFGVNPTWDILCLGQTKKRGAQQRNQVRREGRGGRREMSTDMGVQSDMA